MSLIFDAVIVYFNCDEVFNAWDIVTPILLFVIIFISLVIIHILFCVVLSLFVDKNKTREKPDRLFKFLMEKTLELIFNIFRVKIIANGLEKIPGDRRFLFVSNHRSNFDPMVTIVKLSKYNMAFISKPENFKLPLVGQFINKCCFLPIDRENARNAMRTIHKATDYVKNDVVSMGVYPEGTRSKTGELLEFKDGVFYIAKKSNSPIVVAVVRNTENAFKHVLVKQTKVYIEILGVIEPEDFAELTTHEISEKVRDLMLKSL